MMCHKVGIITHVKKFFGNLHPKNLEGQKRQKFWHNFGQLLTLTMNILGTDQDIENRKQT